MTDQARYEAACMRAKMEMEQVDLIRCEDIDLLRFLKHMRVGVNSAMVDVSVMAKLLIDKGLFTEAEYVKGMADAMDREAKRYEARLSEMLSVEVKLL